MNANKKEKATGQRLASAGCGQQLAALILPSASGLHLSALIGGLVLLLLSVAMTAEPQSPGQIIQRAEQEMAKRPREALLIARQAADLITDRRDLIQRLFTTAARLQEKELSNLSEDQTAELADVYAKTLANPQAAMRVERQWLQRRQTDMAPGDGAGCVHLARLWLRWLHNRKSAAELCQEALRQTPGLTSAATMLRQELDYQLTDTGWKPRHPGSGDRKTGISRLRIGLTANEVRQWLGRPRRIARLYLFRRYLEQWSYGDPPSLWIDFNYLKGQEPYVLTIHELGATKP